jgi:hypothetical protein
MTTGSNKAPVNLSLSVSVLFNFSYVEKAVCVLLPFHTIIQYLPSLCSRMQQLRFAKARVTY